MKYWLVQINVGTIYFFLFSSDILFVFSPSWFWLVGQTFGTVNLKPFFFFFPSTLYLFCIDALRGDISEILHQILLHSWGTMAFLKNLSCQVPRRIVSVWKHPPRTTLWYFALSANTSSEWFMRDSSLRWQLNRLHCLAVRGSVLSRRYFDYKNGAYSFCQKLLFGSNLCRVNRLKLQLHLIFISDVWYAAE